jgi:transcriptional regulator with XRE-family HTH domain
MVNITKIEALIKANGWSNSYFCNLFNKNRGWIRDWKRGKGLPDENTLQAIADKLDTTVDYLTDKTDKKEKPPVNNDKELTEYLQYLKTRPELRMLFDITKDAKKKDIEKAVKIIEAFLKKE